MIRKIEQFMWEGKPIVNQITVMTDNHLYLVSYGKVVASKGIGGPTLSADWDCSKPTAKYVSRFFNRSIKEIRKLIADGAFSVVSELTIE
jgi:hypothetical protein